MGGRGKRVDVEYRDLTGPVAIAEVVAEVATPDAREVRPAEPVRHRQPGVPLRSAPPGWPVPARTDRSDGGRAHEVVEEGIKRAARDRRSGVPWS